jgi:hypothetical protein
MLLLLQIIWICACALALCIYVGWGACHLALPQSLLPQIALFVPLVGYAITIWQGYLGVSSVLNLRWSLALLVALATMLNLLAWRGGARPHLLAALREHAAPLALFALTCLVGVLPLLHYGYATTIGEGWDTESYLPLAQHLNDYALARIPDAPISPMRGLVSKPPAIGVTLGYSVLQGMTMLLSGQTALASFAPLLALLRSLGVLAGYAWLRATMGLGRAAALLAAALISAGALLLWVGYFNFAMQLAGWPLLALGLTLGVAAVEQLAALWAERTEPPRHQDTKSQNISPTLVPWCLGGKLFAILLLAAIVLAALPVAYYPALTFWVPLAAGLAVAILIEQALTTGARAITRLLLAALALGALTLLLAAPTILDYFKGFSFRYSLPAPHVGPDRFIAISEMLGLQAFRLPDDGPQTPAALVWIASVIAGLLLVAGLALPTKDEGRTTKDEQPAYLSSFVLRLSSAYRLRWLGVMAATAAYLAWLRFGQAYQYGYMKGSAYAGLAAWGAVALGAQALWWWAARSKVRRVALAGLAALLLLTTAWAQALTIADHWSGPANFRRDVATFDQATSRIPANASVFVTSDGSFTGPTSGLFATMLYGREIWGHLSTAYTGLNYWPEGRMPQYALLAAGERAWPLELGGRELWRSDAAALYQLDPRMQVLLGRSDIYSPAPVASKKSPAALEIWRRGGANRAAEPDAPLTLLLGETPRFGPGQPTGAAGPQIIQLTLASLSAQPVSLAYNSTSSTVNIPAGVSQLALGIAGPTTLTITPRQTLALIDATELPGGSTPPGARLDEAQIAWSAAAEQRGDSIQLRVRMANPGHHALRIGLTIVEDAFDRPEQLAQVLAAAPLDDVWQISVNTVSGATEARVGKQPTPLLKLNTAPHPPDTQFFGILNIYDGEQAVAHAPVFTFKILNGKPAMFAPVPFTVEATPAGPPSAPLPGNRRRLLGDAARPIDQQPVVLQQALLARRTPYPGAPPDAPFAPGAPLTTQLFWQAGSTPAAAAVGVAPPMMISLQLLGADSHKWAQWDGTLGGDWRPVQAWQPGEQVRQDVPLQIDPATPPGAYRLVLVVYDPASGRPETFGGQSSLDLGELVVQ